MRPPVPSSLALAGLVVAGALLAGCGPPPQLSETPAPPQSPPPTSLHPSPGRPSLPPELPGTPSAGGGYPDEIAIICDGRPTAEEMLAVLRQEEMLGAGVEAEVVEGPYCSGEWQYAVVSVPERDPLRMVTRGDPEALALITAGTDVCSVEVRYQAPVGIQGAAGC